MVSSASVSKRLPDFSSGVCCLLENIKQAIDTTGEFSVFCNQEERCAKPEDLDIQTGMVNIKIVSSSFEEKIPKAVDKIGTKQIKCYQKETRFQIQIWVRGCGENKTFCRASAIAAFIVDQLDAPTLCVESFDPVEERYTTSGSGQNEISFFAIDFDVTHIDCPGVEPV